MGRSLPEDRVLREAKPSELPVQTPLKYETVINIKPALPTALVRDCGRLCPPRIARVGTSWHNDNTLSHLSMQDRKQRISVQEVAMASKGCWLVPEKRLIAQSVGSDRAPAECGHGVRACDKAMHVSLTDDIANFRLGRARRRFRAATCSLT